MDTVVKLIFLAAFAVIGTVKWLRELVDASEAGNRKVVLWQSITGIFSVFIGTTLAAAFPAAFAALGVGVLTSIWFLAPTLSMLVLSTIQLGYDLVIQTFLKLVKALGGLADSAVAAAERVLEKGEEPAKVGFTATEGQ